MARPARSPGPHVVGSRRWGASNCRLLDVVETDRGTDLVPQHLDVGRFTALAGVVEHRRVDRDDCGDPSDLAAHLEPGRASEPGDRSRAGISSVSSAKPVMTGAQQVLN